MDDEEIQSHIDKLDCYDLIVCVQLTEDEESSSPSPSPPPLIVTSPVTDHYFSFLPYNATEEKAVTNLALLSATKPLRRKDHSLTHRANEFFKFAQSVDHVRVNIYDRRVTDVTSIAVAIGVLQKVSKGIFKWKGLDHLSDKSVKFPAVVLKSLRRKGTFHLSEFKCDKSSLKRRLIDVMNVFVALGLVTKIGIGLYQYTGRK